MTTTQLLHHYFKGKPYQRIPRDKVAEFLNVTSRTAQTHINRLNEYLMDSGSRFIVCSSTDAGEFSGSKVDKSGYIYTDDPATTEKHLKQITSHALSELKKRRPAKVILKRQKEFILKQVPPPVVEESGQARLQL